MTEKFEGGMPLQTQESKEAITQELQKNLEFYLSAMWGYQDRPEEILKEARKHGISLDLDTAIKNGINRALSEEAAENLDLIIAFAEKNDASLDLSQPDTQRAIEHCYAKLLSKSKSLLDLKKFIDKHDLSIDVDAIFQQALTITLDRGDGQTVNNLVRRIEKENRNVNFADSEVMQALKRGLAKKLHEGRADIVNRLINFAQRVGISVETGETEFVSAAKEGLIKIIKDMRLGPGGVTIAEGMIKLIKKLELPIDLKAPEVISACKEAVETAKQSHFPRELQMFSARPHIEEFLKKYGINID